MTEIKLDHIAIVIDDMDSALRFWRELFGLAPAPDLKTIAEEEVNIAFLSLGEAQIELIQPTSGDSGVAKYLAKRGPGLHHLCLEVPDLDARLQALRAAGCELINEAPRQRDGRRYAFIHPRSAGGVLLELYEKT